MISQLSGRSLTLVTNRADDPEMEERVTQPAQVMEQSRKLGLAYPRDVYSLSHVALPFPSTDGLYGPHPDPNDDFGVNLGSLAPFGEVGVLIISLDSLTRITWNPFFPYLLARIEEGIVPSSRR